MKKYQIMYLCNISIIKRLNYDSKRSDVFREPEISDVPRSRTSRDLAREGKKICLTAFDLILLNKKYEIYNFK